MKKISRQEKEFIEANRRFVSHDTPFPWKQAFTKTLLWLLVLSYLCGQWANYFFVAWMPNYLQEGKHFSEQEMKMTTSWLFVFVKKAHPDDYAPVAGKSATAASVVNNLKVKLSCR